jgi:uncharacterized membrane protein
MTRTRAFWLASGLVTLVVLAFCIYFISYLTIQHDAFMTNAEDLGIMDQVFWSITSGHLPHQTICNILHDTNCYSLDGIPRFAIHFEPILFPLSLFYLIWPSPKTLLVVQTVIVALGAYPAYWLARLRLRNEWASVGIAVLYLLYPGLQQALVFDFHAVTLTASLLMFTLYFMYTQRTVWLFVFALLAIACKEEVCGIIALYGLWSIIFQRRWRTGLALMVIGVAWFAIITYVIYPAFSPTGKPLLIGRYASLGNGPVEIFKTVVLHPRSFLNNYVLEHDRFNYLKSLFVPTGYLLLLAPWIWLLALPTLAVNMLSSNPTMYSGMFQYNAEIVPVLIFATIEAIVLILWLVQLVTARFSVQGAAERKPSSAFASASGWQSRRWLHAGLLALLTGLVLVCSVRSDYYFHGNMPFSQNFHWPQVTQHNILGQRLAAEIPPNASVSAQTMLVPHISQRERIYQFPYAKDVADYIFVDVTGDIYPYYNAIDYAFDVKSLWADGQHQVVAAQDGYLLLKRIPSAPGSASASSIQITDGTDNTILSSTPQLSEKFCSYMYVSSQEITNPLQATFTDTHGASMDLLGFNVAAPSTFSKSSGYMSITTYWKISAPLTSSFQPLFFLNGSDGKQYFASDDVPAILWCQTNGWKPGLIVKLTTRLFGLQRLPAPNGLAHMSIAVLPLTASSSTIMNVKPRLSVRVVNAPSVVSVIPDANALQLVPMTITP